MKTMFSLISIGVAGRLLSLPHGLSLTGALILLAAVLLPWRKALATALSIVMIGDLITGVHQVVPWTWTGALLIAGVGIYYLKRSKWSYPRVAVAAFVASTAYYLWVDSGVWFLGGCLPGEKLYEATFAGLMDVYRSGFPYFIQGAIGNVCSSMLVFAIAKHFFKLTLVREPAAVKS